MRAETYDLVRESADAMGGEVREHLDRLLELRDQGALGVELETVLDLWLAMWAASQRKASENKERIRKRLEKVATRPRSRHLDIEAQR